MNIFKTGLGKAGDIKFHEVVLRVSQFRMEFVKEL